jgi:hypothetical protein
MQLSTHDLIELISIGEHQTAIAVDKLQYFKNKDYINRQGFQTWKMLLVNASDNDLIMIFKGIVYVEKELNWIGGSVAGAIWVYREIQNRGLDREGKIADFGFKNSDNPWVPYGSLYCGKRSVEDYNSHLTEERIKKTAKAEKYSKLLFRIECRKERRIRSIAELRKLSREMRGAIRDDLSEKYKNSTTLEKLEIIASDNKYPPEYYPLEWISIDKVEIENLPIILLKNLHDKLSSKTRGKWKRFVNELKKLDDGL